MTENKPQESSTLPLSARIEADFKQALRNQDATAKMTLRAVKTALTEAGKAGADHALSEDDVLAVIQREAKRRREAAAEYVRVGATAQAAQEEAELAVLEGYLPRQLEDAEVEEMARQIIAETGASTPRDLGQVMPKLMARMGASADGKQASQIVRRLLSA